MSRQCAEVSHTPVISPREFFIPKDVAQKEHSMKRSFIIGSIAGLSLTVFFAASGWGKTGGSTIFGKVKNPSGALVSGATVARTNLETNAVRTVVTTTSGSFSFEF